MELPEPVIESAYRGKSQSMTKKKWVVYALNRLAAEDPSFRIKSDERVRVKLAIRRMGELHLEIIVDRVHVVKLMLNVVLVSLRLLIARLSLSQLLLNILTKNNPGGSWSVCEELLLILSL